MPTFFTADFCLTDQTFNRLLKMPTILNADIFVIFVDFIIQNWNWVKWWIVFWCILTPFSSYFHLKFTALFCSFTVWLFTTKKFMIHGPVHDWTIPFARFHWRFTVHANLTQRRELLWTRRWKQQHTQLKQNKRGESSTLQTSRISILWEKVNKVNSKLRTSEEMEKQQHNCKNSTKQTRGKFHITDE